VLAGVPGLGLVWDLNHTHPASFGDYLALAPWMSMLHISDTPLPQTNHHLPLGQGTIDFAHYTHELLARGFRGRAILEIGGLPKSGGFGRDTDAALIDSRARLLAAIV
jgi:sugar phosphate isomerase/epimerase